MTTLYEQIKAQIIETMKGQAEDKTIRLLVLRGLKSAIDLQAKEGMGEITDALVETVLVRELKKRNDSMEQYAQVGAIQLHNVEMTEALIISTFLPTQMTEEEVRSKLAEVVAQHGPNIGPVMKEMRAFCGARFPGKNLADLVKAAVAR